MNHIKMIYNSYSEEPLKLYGEGNYALTSVKEVVVTDSFLSMKAETRNCQVDELYEDCETEEYLERVRTVCSCIPVNLMTEERNEKVILALFPSIIIQK